MTSKRIIRGFVRIGLFFGVPCMVGAGVMLGFYFYRRAVLSNPFERYDATFVRLDSEQLGMAAILAGAGLAIFTISAAIGWVLAGFARE